MAFSQHTLYTGRGLSIPPYRHFERSREIFLARRRSLLLSLKVSHFPLSHIRRYTDVQERSLDFARDDDTGIALYKHIRCTLRGINPFPHTVISSAARNLPCTLFFLAPFTEGFPFSAIPHTAPYRCTRKIEDFARDDDTGIALSKHIRCTLRGINPFPPYRHEGRSEKSSLHSVVPYSFHGRFPIFRYPTYSAIPMCKKDPSTSVGMTMRMALCSRYFHAVTPKSASSRHIDPSLWPAPSLRKSKKGS